MTASDDGIAMAPDSASTLVKRQFYEDIDLARYLMEVAIRFTREEFRWIQRQHFYPAGLNE